MPPPSNEGSDYTEPSYQADPVDADDRGDPLLVFDVDCPQSPMFDQALVRRTRTVNVHRESDGSTRQVRHTAYDLSPGTRAPETPAIGDRNDFTAHTLSTITSTSHGFFPAPTKPLRSQDEASPAPYYSLPPSTLDSKSTTGTADEELAHGPHRKSHRTWRRFVCIVGLSFANLVCGLSVTIMTTASITFTRGLNVTAGQSLWTPASLLLTGALFQPLLMRLSHVTGCKPLIVVGLSIYAGMSLASALFGKRLLAMLIFRSAAGIGFASIRTLTPLVIAQLVDSKHKTWHDMWPALSFWLGASAGPILGTAVVESLDRRVIFWIEAVISVSGLALLSLLRLQSRETALIKTKLGKIDYIGWTLLLIAVTTTVVILSQTKLTFSSLSWWTGIPFLGACIPAVLWCSYVGRSSDPIIPASIFRDRKATAACIATFMQNSIFAGVIYSMPSYVGVVRNLSAINSGFQSSAWAFSVFLASFIVANILHHGTTINSRVMSIITSLTTLACLSVIFGLGHTAQLASSTSHSFITAGTLLAGLGLGTLTPMLCTIIQIATTSDDETIHALSLFNFIGSLGLLFGIVVGSALFIE